METERDLNQKFVSPKPSTAIIGSLVHNYETNSRTRLQLALPQQLLHFQGTRTQWIAFSRVLRKFVWFREFPNTIPNFHNNARFDTQRFTKRDVYSYNNNTTIRRN